MILVAAAARPCARLGGGIKVIIGTAYGEETARRLIVLHDRSGNPDAARRAYRRLCRVLQDDLDVDPSPETTALVEDILRRSGGRARASVMNR
ncbi:MAG TPA: bacterial transcriptional activator domain-containing protein [Streptosporangiaceae bacterium]